MERPRRRTGRAGRRGLQPRCGSAAHTGRRIVEAVYPQRLGPMDQAEAEESPPVPKIPFTEVLQKSDGVLLAFDFKGLLELARKHAIAIELVPRVGDFVSRESTLFRVYGGTRVPEGAPGAGAGTPEALRPAGLPGAGGPRTRGSRRLPGHGRGVTAVGCGAAPEPPR